MSDQIRKEQTEHARIYHQTEDLQQVSDLARQKAQLAESQKAAQRKAQTQEHPVLADQHEDRV